LKADSENKKKFFKNALKVEDKKRTDAIKEKADWDKEKTRLTGLWDAAAAGGAKTAAKGALDLHTGAADGTEFAKGKAIDAKVTASKSAYRTLMAEADAGEEELRKLELEQERKAGDKMFDAVKKTFDNAKKEKERIDEDIKHWAEAKGKAETQADWEEFEKRYQKAVNGKTAAETAYETARNGLNTEDLAKRARDKSLTKIAAAAKDKADKL